MTLGDSDAATSTGEVGVTGERKAAVTIETIILDLLFFQRDNRDFICNLLF